MKRAIKLVALLTLASGALQADLYYSNSEYQELADEKYALEIELKTVKNTSLRHRADLNTRIEVLKDKLAKTQDENVRKSDEIENLKNKISQLEKKSAEDQRLAELRINDLTEQITTLKKQSSKKEKELLETIKTNEKKYLAEIKKLKDDLEQTRKEKDAEINKLNQDLVQLKRIIADQQEKLNAMEKQALALEKKLESEIKDGQLRIKRFKDKLVINLDDKILFASGSAQLKQEVKLALAKIVEILAEHQGNRIIIEGHTDNIPIRTRQFRDSWQLSTERALSVLNFILDNSELPPGRFSAAGYAEYQPVAPNDTAANRQKNRRVDIVLIPN